MARIIRGFGSIIHFFRGMGSIFDLSGHGFSFRTRNRIRRFERRIPRSQYYPKSGIEKYFGAVGYYLDRGVANYRESLIDETSTAK